MVLLHLLFNNSGSQWVHSLFNTSAMACILSINQGSDEHSLWCIYLLHQFTSSIFHSWNLRVSFYYVLLYFLHVLPTFLIDLLMVNIAWMREQVIWFGRFQSIRHEISLLPFNRMINLLNVFHGPCNTRLRPLPRCMVLRLIIFHLMSSISHINTVLSSFHCFLSLLVQVLCGLLPNVLLILSQWNYVVFQV